jgi:hypothetical protein
LFFVLLIFVDLPILVYLIAGRKGSLMKVPFALSQEKGKTEKNFITKSPTRARLVCVCVCVCVCELTSF